MYRIYYDINRTIRVENYHTTSLEESLYLEADTLDEIKAKIQTTIDEFVKDEVDRLMKSFNNTYIRNQMIIVPNSYWHDNIMTIDWKTPIMKLADENDTEIMKNTDTHVIEATRNAIHKVIADEKVASDIAKENARIKKEQDDFKKYQELKERFEGN